MSEQPLPDIAQEAGLVYADDSMDWRRRVKRGKGFSYREPDGTPAGDDVTDWIRTLAIPPAWTEVRIASTETSHILATGQDRAGRKQYIYHPTWEEMRDEVKFARMAQFGRRIARLRRRVDSDLRSPGLSRRKVSALAVAVLDRTLIRVGNRRSAGNGDSYGLTTLTSEHVEVDGAHVHLAFVGKGGSDHEVAFRDRRLAALILRCQELSGQSLFSYHSDDAASSLGSTDINDYLADALGGRFTAKDFRTWGATTTVTGELAGSSHPDAADAWLSALDCAAERLGNSREVCRSSYVHPGIADAFADGRLAQAWVRSRTGVWINRSESAVAKLLYDET